MSASQVRQNFHEDCEEAINRQINMELFAFYTYLSFVNIWCEYLMSWFWHKSILRRFTSTEMTLPCLASTSTSRTRLTRNAGMQWSSWNTWTNEVDGSFCKTSRILKVKVKWQLLKRWRKLSSSRSRWTRWELLNSLRIFKLSQTYL